MLQSMGSQKSQTRLRDCTELKESRSYFWILYLHRNYLAAVSTGEGNGNSLQYSCLGNPIDGGAWWAAVHGVAKSRTRLMWR